MNDDIRTSLLVFGVPGFRPSELRRGPAADARMRRYRKALEGLSDRQLLNRFERYLRGADRAAAWRSRERTLNACGLFSQQLHRLKAARDALRLRNIRPPKRWEAYMHQRPEETYPPNLDVLRDGRTWNVDRVEAELRAVEERLLEHQEDEILMQRYLMVGSLLERLEALRLRPELDIIATHLERRIGWRLKPVEVERLLSSSGDLERGAAA